MATAALLTLVSCGDGEGVRPGIEGTGADEPVVPDPGPAHVHGLGVNPRDQSLFIATDMGMLRIPEGEDEAARVGDNDQDTMGFTVVGPTASWLGLSDLRQDLPPFLGPIGSEDAGEQRKWRSLLGQADFHYSKQLVIDLRLWVGLEDPPEEFLVSRDGGEEWKELDPPSR